MKTIIEVQSLENYELLLTFENGEKRLFDMKPYLSHGIFQGLKDVKIFKSVKINFDTIEWPNGADLCPDVVYEKSKSVS